MIRPLRIFICHLALLPFCLLPYGDTVFLSPKNAAMMFLKAEGLPLSPVGDMIWDFPASKTVK